MHTLSMVRGPIEIEDHLIEWHGVLPEVTRHLDSDELRAMHHTHHVEQVFAAPSRQHAHQV